MTYYVEPDYWVSGYAVGDYAGQIVYGFAATTASADLKSSGNYTTTSHREVSRATVTIIAAPILISVYPGVNLNAKSQTVAGGAATYNSTSGLVMAHSDSRMSGRIFWEQTQPASGVWTEIVPQAEGTGH